MKKLYTLIVLIAVAAQITSCKKDVNKPGKPQETAKTPDKLSYTGTVTLSVPRIYMVAAGAGNKILIAGGETADNNSSNVVDIYDVAANKWSATKFSKLQGPQLFVGTTGKKIIFSDGATALEIYDADSGVWKTATMQLSVQREFIAFAVAAGKVFFAGGVTGSSNGFTQFTDAVDIYDIATDKWSVGQPLNYPRVCSAAGSTTNKVVFGGIDVTWYGSAYHGGLPIELENNDIYSIDASGSVKVKVVNAFLNQDDTPAGTNGNYILFSQSIYNAADDTFTDMEPYFNGISIAYRHTIIGAGTKFIVGLDFTPNIDVYDIVSKTWATLPTGETRVRVATATAGNTILLAGGVVVDGPDPSSQQWNASDKVDIFTLSK